MRHRLYHFEELAPTAQKRALEAHVAYLRPYFMELLTAHFLAELRRAGEPEGVPIFEPDLESLREEGVRIEGADVSPGVIERLRQAGLAEMTIQLSEERLVQSIRLEGVRYYHDGTEVEQG